MRLFLVQHGEAVPDSIDPNRPLTPTGRDDVEQLAAFLAAAGVRVARVLNSGKLRARDSAEILAGAIAPGVVVEDRQGMLPKDSTERLAEEASGWKRDTLVVGHQPYMSRFVSRLVLGAEAPLVVDFIPGTAACLERREVTGAWFLGWVITPDLLRR
jgi:phosphohistidine phosphatase